jgi:hypothetical protein
VNLYTYAVIADTARDHVLSARPGAPTVPERPPRTGENVRRATARTLRRWADRVEPKWSYVDCATR